MAIPYGVNTLTPQEWRTYNQPSFGPGGMYGSDAGQIPISTLFQPGKAFGAASVSSSGGGGGGAGGYPASLTAPGVSNYQFSKEATSYPQFLRSQGENNAQRIFENKVNQGVRAGTGFQGYARGLEDLNQNRLNYMTSAGREQMGVEGAVAGQQNTYQDLLAKLFGTLVGQRGQDVSYQEVLAHANAMIQSANARGSNGGYPIDATTGNPIRTTGVGTPSRDPATGRTIYTGGYTNIRGQTGAPPSYVGLGGRYSSELNPAPQNTTPSTPWSKF